VTGHDDLRLQTVQLGAARIQAVTDAASLAAQADAAQAAATQAAAVGDQAGYAAALATSSDLHQARRDRLGSISAVDSDLAGLLHALAGDPCDLEADVPLALLPVRLETRYSPDKTSLLVRIFPDDVHLDRLDRGLSADERTAGIAYWTAIWDGPVTEAQAWQQLVATVHSARAYIRAYDHCFPQGGCPRLSGERPDLWLAALTSDGSDAPSATQSLGRSTLRAPVPFDVEERAVALRRRAGYPH
jgi:hypothetical protein